MVDSVSVRLKTRVSKNMPLNIRIQWNAGTACVSECVLKALACQGLRVGPSKFPNRKLDFQNLDEQPPSQATQPPLTPRQGSEYRGRVPDANP